MPSMYSIADEPATSCGNAQLCRFVRNQPTMPEPLNSSVDFFKTSMISPAAFQIVSSVTLRTDPEHLARVQPDVRFHNTSLDTRFPVPGAQNIVRNWYLAYVRLLRDLQVHAIGSILHTPEKLCNRR